MAVCFACGKECVGELCNACIRSEEVKYSKEWTYKEGLLKKRTEDFKVVVSSMRISGHFAISDNTSGTNARMDSATHYIGNVKEVATGSFGKADCPAIVIENSKTGMKRYLLMPQFDGTVGDLQSAIQAAKA